jgi:hypothetical protein
LEYAEHVREVSGSNKKQIEFMDKYYMNPFESRMTLDKMEIYEGKNLKTE